MIHIKFAKELIDKIKERSKSMGLTVTGFIRFVVIEYLNK
jgi:hypothetical protein